MVIIGQTGKQKALYRYDVILVLKRKVPTHITVWANLKALCKIEASHKDDELCESRCPKYTKSVIPRDKV